MAQVTVTVGSRVGLHARPAALFAQAAAKAAVPVRIGKPGEDPVDARSILSLLTVGASFGDEVVLSADGDGAETVLADLAALVASDLDAEPAAPPTS